MTIWQHLEHYIQRHADKHFKLNGYDNISGGDVNQCYRLSGDNSTYFVKLNDCRFAPMFKAEAKGLSAMAHCPMFRIPKTVGFGNYQNHSYLILEYVDMSSQGDMAKFASALASMHRLGHDKFGFDDNNYIGRTIQPNGWRTNWGRFFSEQRIGHQLGLLRHQGLGGGMIAKGCSLLPLLADYLNSHCPKPALVHGDLWQGNYAFDSKGKPVLYDPACYYGDHEVDLAMLELFGDPGETFFEHYQSIFPIKPGYGRRKMAYNLYHLLNHASLFGDSYIRQAETIIDVLLKELK